MPHFLSHDRELNFFYDYGSSTAENRFVSNIMIVAHSYNSTIIIPSTTANLELWANNSRVFDRIVQQYNTNFDVQFADAMDKWDNLNSSFSGNWVNITNTPFVEKSSNMFIINAPIRYVRLQGGALTGSASASIGYLWTSNSEPMI